MVIMSKLMFIENEWVPASNEKQLNVYDPSKGAVIETVPSATRDDVHRAVDAAADAFKRGTWSKIPPGDRANTMLRVAQTLEQRSDEFIRLESANSGKSLKQCTFYDVPYTIDNIRFLAGAARVVEGKAMQEYVIEGTSAIRREPIGVVGVITPWNYPLMMVVWRAMPALLMGNTVVIKPATYTPLSTIEFAKILEEVGLPKGVVNVVTGPGSEVGEELAKHPKVDMIAFTGSTEVGKRLSELGSNTVKKVSLELGGKAPFIVFDDADIEAAVQGAVVGGLVNNGQDCSNSTRYYIHESILDEFSRRLDEELDKVKIGDTSNMTTDMGPLVSDAHRKRVEGYIKKGMEEGGRVLRGGTRPVIPGHEGGYYLEPTVIQTDRNDSTIVQEEIFGPVFAVLKFNDYDEVIEKSNSVVYGLGASVWTKDVTRSMRAIRDLRFGTVWVNDHVPIPSEMPWAGYKQSGHGASMSSYSLEEFSYIKHVYVNVSGNPRKSWHFTVYGQKS
jgi:betaine-aldehyde dehydrogenase